MFDADRAARSLEPHNRVAGKFRLGKRLASGGMGEVWVARNESTGADVALKVLRRGDSDHEHELRIEERFRHEATLSAMLSHRSIVKVFDLIEEPSGLLVLVMELLRGETLQAYLERKGPRPGREAVAIVCPILSALAHAHDRGIVHRDVTPSNIFLAVDPDGHVTPKVVDFGVAKLVAGASLSGSRAQPVQTVDGRVLGTPRYMAPERIRGSAEVDGRSDLFAVGVVAYEIMTGASPFAASSPSASLAAVLERPVDLDPRIEPRLWLEVRRATSKRAYERHESANEMATALRAAVGESEGALDATLRRSLPPEAWQTDEGLFEGPPRENKTIEGQSLGAVPRRAVSPPVWTLAGVLVGATLAASAFGIHAMTTATPRVVQPAVPRTPQPAAFVVAVPPSPLPSENPAVSAAPSALPASVLPAATAADTPTPPPPRHIAPVATARPAPVAPSKLKSIATTPGF